MLLSALISQERSNVDCNGNARIGRCVAPHTLAAVVGAGLALTFPEITFLSFIKATQRTHHPDCFSGGFGNG
jgi:hypothetical protein